MRVFRLVVIVASLVMSATVFYRYEPLRQGPVRWVGIT
jgi:hypothetical protein